MERLPVLISIPHGGEAVPEELEESVILQPADLMADGDAFTRSIYNVREQVSEFLQADIARVYVDLNRDVQDRPPQNPDGVVKSMTCHQVPIYRDHGAPDEAMTGRLLDRYYHPYHQALSESLARNPSLQLALDCHSMLGTGPAIGPDTGQRRPIICLGTRHGETAPEYLARRMIHCLQKTFRLEPGEVTLDDPFAGGYITRRHGTGRVPFMQVELNRDLYLKRPWFDAGQWKVDPVRLDYLRDCFRNALTLYFDPEFKTP